QPKGLQPVAEVGTHGLARQLVEFVRAGIGCGPGEVGCQLAYAVAVTPPDLGGDLVERGPGHRLRHSLGGGPAQRIRDRDRFTTKGDKALDHAVGGCGEGGASRRAWRRKSTIRWTTVTVLAAASSHSTMSSRMIALK